MRDWPRPPRRARSDDRAVAKATAALGKVLEAKGSYDKAVPVLEEAVRLESRPGFNALDTAATLKELADTQFYAGRYDLCESLTQRTLAIHRQALGERHPLDCRRSHQPRRRSVRTRALRRSRAMVPAGARYQPKLVRARSSGNRVHPFDAGPLAGFPKAL